MYTTEHPILVEREVVTVERPPPPIVLTPANIAVPSPAPPVSVEATPQERIRDETGHCWDGIACDHPDHGSAGGPVHLIR
jgi:hypothetical protein